MWCEELLDTSCTKNYEIKAKYAQILNGERWNEEQL